MTNYTRALFFSNTAEERVELLRILAKRDVLMGVIKDELTGVVSSYGDARRTEIVDAFTVNVVTKAPDFLLPVRLGELFGLMESRERAFYETLGLRQFAAEQDLGRAEHLSRTPAFPPRARSSWVIISTTAYHPVPHSGNGRGGLSYGATSHERKKREHGASEGAEDPLRRVTPLQLPVALQADGR